MTYDMMIRQPSSSTATTDRHHHHASMHVVEDAMEGFVRTGCPPSKLVMGIPAYGRHERDPGLVRTYSELVDEIIIANNGGGDDGMSETETEATTAKTTTAVVLRSINSRSGYRFDSPDDVRAKVEYALRSGLGGVFIWELGQDKRMPGQAEGGVLLEAAAAAAASAVDRSAGDVPGDEL
jgi:GH18 family chitinase